MSFSFLTNLRFLTDADTLNLNWIKTEKMDLKVDEPFAISAVRKIGHFWTFCLAQKFEVWSDLFLGFF